jgi:hypothetical protein
LTRRVLLALLLLLCSCAVEPKLGQPVEPTAEQIFENTPEAGCFADTNPYASEFGYGTHVAWGRVYSGYRARDCRLHALEFWTHDTGVVDVYVCLSQVATEPVLSLLGLRLDTGGFHSIPLGDQIVRGQKMVLYAVVKFTADHSRHPLLYDPKNPIAKQWVSPDGDPDGWKMWNKGNLAIRLVAPYVR